MFGVEEGAQEVIQSKITFPSPQEPLPYYSGLVWRPGSVKAGVLCSGSKRASACPLVAKYIFKPHIDYCVQLMGF